jgi:hypothetical protein
LPERWRLALWKTEVEGVKPRDLADELGLSANATSALIYRAREGLREAYLLEHLARPVSAPCGPIVELLPAYLRGNLPIRRTRHVAEHVAGCAACTQRLVELARLNNRFGAIVLAPALVGLASTITGGTGLPVRMLQRLGGALLHTNAKVWSAAAVVLVFGAGAVELLHSSNTGTVALAPVPHPLSTVTGPSTTTAPTAPTTQPGRLTPVPTPTRPSAHPSTPLPSARSTAAGALPVASVTSPTAQAATTARPADKPSSPAPRVAVTPARSTPTVVHQPAPATTSVTNEFNDNSSAITYAGTTWSSAGGRGLGDFDDDVHETTTDGESATLTFTGTGASFITEMSSVEGDVAISIDGGAAVTVNTDSAARKAQRTVFSVSALANGTHTITVTKLSGQVMVVDAFTVTTAKG